jgi:hypothetical protein
LQLAICAVDDSAEWDSTDDIWNCLSLSQEQKTQAIAEFQRREYAKKMGRNEVRVTVVSMRAPASRAVTLPVALMAGP